MKRWTVECVCTDRGQHKRTWIARMIWDAPFVPTDDQRASYRAALRHAGPFAKATEQVDALVARMGHGGWHTFISGSDQKHDMFGPPLSDADPGSVVSRESYGFACSRCERWPRIHKDRWIALMNAARLAGVTEFDVSYLD